MFNVFLKFCNNVYCFDYLQSTLKALDLRFDLDELKANDTIRHWKSIYPKRKRSKPVVEILEPEEPAESPTDLRTDLLN